MYTKQDFKTWDRSPIEKIHLLSFCKSSLEANYKASNLACGAELGRLPLIIPINEKIMKYFIYLNNKDNNSTVKKSFLMSENLHSVNNSGFCSNFMNMVEQNNPSTLDPGCLGIDEIRRSPLNLSLTHQENTHNHWVPLASSQALDLFSEKTKGYMKYHRKVIYNPNNI